MKTIINKTGILMISLLMLACSSGGGDDSPSTDPDPEIIDPPGSASLVYPENNSECTTGTNLTSSQSTIVFDWNDSNNTDSYKLFVKNLETQEIKNYASSVSEKSVTISRGTPFSWYVVSENSGTQTSQSSTWKFYNAGEATTSYAPFPAELISPNLSATLNSSTTSVSLEWSGEDVDNDIKDYEVYFGTSSPPSTKVGTLAETSFSVTVNSGNTYYWSVTTNDNQGNSSESQIFKFTIE